MPTLIPLARFNLAVPAFAVASSTLPNRASRVIGGALLMLAWDLFADPVVGRHFHSWVWHELGKYYGIPGSNFASWFLVSLLIMAWLDHSAWMRTDNYGNHPFLVHYGASLLMVVGLAIIYRMGFAILVGAMPLLILQGIRWFPLGGKRGITAPICFNGY